MRLQDDRLADLASDDARRARLEAIAASVEMERGRECTFKPALSCGTARRLADQENTDPADEVSLLLSAWRKLRHWQHRCLTHSLQVSRETAMLCIVAACGLIVADASQSGLTRSAW